MLALQSSSLTPAQAKEYDRNGFLILRGVFAPDEVKELGTAFSEAGKDGPVAGLSDGHVSGERSQDPLRHWPRMMNPHRRPDLLAGRLSYRALLDARLTGVVHELFGEEPIAAQSMFYFKPPGARGQALHQDNFYLRVSPGTCLAAWIAIDDSHQDNGGLHVVPRTQHFDVLCPEQADLEQSFVNEFIPVPSGHEAVPALLDPGDVLFFNGSVIHGSGPNQSARFRRSLIFHYVPSSCAEISSWYSPLLRPDGSVVERAKATGGGPCGTTELAAPH